MKEIGMLFSTDMVKAILLNQKTCTRRLIKLKDLQKNFDNLTCEDYPWFWTNKSNKQIYATQEGILEKAPVYKGDRIYVRETWQESFNAELNKWEPIYFADNKTVIDCDEVTKWKPSLFMPRKYARIWFEVTDVDIGKISDITEEESIKEGFSSKKALDIYWKNRYNDFDRYVWIINFRRIGYGR